MSLNGSGTYNVNSAGQPVVADTLITDTAFNAFTADIATALSTAMFKDGQATPTANIPLGGYKLTNVGAATALTDAATLLSLQNGVGVYVATVGGTADAITLTASPAITAYVAGQAFFFKAGSTNTTAVTVAISGLATKAIQRNGSALVAGNIVANRWYRLTYDGTAFQMEQLSAPEAGLTMTGAINTQRATVASAATTSAIWAAEGNEIDFTGTATITDFPAAPQAGAERILICAGACIFTHAGNISVQGAANHTAAAGDIVRVHALTTTTFRLTVQKADGTPVVVTDATLSTSDITTNNASTSKHGFLKKLDNTATNFMNGQGNWSAPSGILTAGTSAVMNPFTVNTSTNYAHGLGVTPVFEDVYLECLTSELGYAIGDRIKVGLWTVATESGFIYTKDATNIGIITGAAAPRAINRATPAGNVALTATSWKIVIVPYKLN